MGGPRAPGHRETFGGRHAATALAAATLLFQPILQVCSRANHSDKYDQLDMACLTSSGACPAAPNRIGSSHATVTQAGNYNQPTAPGAPYTKASFDTTLSKAGFEGKTVPTLDAFFPFAKYVLLLLSSS